MTAHLPVRAWIFRPLLIALALSGLPGAAFAQRAAETPLERSHRAVARGETAAAEAEMAAIARRPRNSAGWHHEMAVLLTHLALADTAGDDAVRQALGSRILAHLALAEGKLGVSDRGLAAAVKEHRAFVTQRIAGRSDEALVLYRQARDFAPELGQAAARVERIEAAQRDAARVPALPPVN